MAHGRNRGGGTKRTADKFTQEMRNSLQGIFDNYAAGQLHLDLKATEPDTRLRFMLEVAKLITPKPPQIAGFDQQEQPIFAGINLEVEDKPFPAPIIVM